MSWLLPLLTACGSGGGGDLETLQILRLAIEPEAATVRTGPGGGEAVQFAVTATFDNGTTAPVELLEWTVSNQSAGAVDDAGLFVPSTANGGDTWVTARLDNLDAQATVTVIYEDTLTDADVDPDLFGEPSETLTDAWLYPPDGVNIPRNTPSIDFQWRGDADLWRLRFSGAYTELTVYTDEPSWAADEDTWQTIAATNAGGVVAVELAGLQPDGSTAAAAPLTIQVNRLDARGSIFYWSTSVEGFKEIPYGEASRDYLTSAETGACMGCHTIQGDRMAFTYDVVDGAMEVVGLDDREALTDPEEELVGNFKSFSPDGGLLLATYRGALLLYHGETLEYLWEVPLSAEATHVDWSPDGRQVVMVLSNSLITDAQFRGGRLALMDHLGSGQFDTPEPLYLPGEGENAYYPTWSPDGQWIAFNLSTGDAYDDEDATLMVMRPDPGAEPIALTQANGGEQLTNSWPRWGPLPDDDVLWLTFASRRPYGAVTEGIPQIWVAAFDPERAEAGEDPSWPAFWLPSQEPAENNHLPYWTDGSP